MLGTPVAMAKATLPCMAIPASDPNVGGFEEWSEKADEILVSGHCPALHCVTGRGF